MTLNYKSFGEGDPIIILHGLFGMLDNWQTIGKQLAQDYQVVLVDQRNHGKSIHSDEFSYDLLADDLKGLMTEMELSSAHVIGHSMGGKTAMTFAANYADMINSLIVVDIAPKPYEGGHEELFEAILAVDIGAVSSRKAVDEQLKLSIPDDGVRLFLMKNLTRKPEGGYRWKANFEVLHQQYQQLMDFNMTGTHIVPSLFIRGENSDYILEEDEELIYDLFPLAVIEDIENAGHWIHAEQPQLFLDLVTDYLDRVSE